MVKSLIQKILPQKLACTLFFSWETEKGICLLKRIAILVEDFVPLKNYTVDQWND